MNKTLRLGLWSYSSDPYANQNPNFLKLNSPQSNYYYYSCKKKSLNSLAKCLGSSAGWLLAPAGIGTTVALLLAFGSPDIDGCDQRLSQKAVGATVIYTAFATLVLALYVYYELNNHQDHLLASYLPLSVGFAMLMVFYGAIYFLIYRLDPHSFLGEIGDDFITQFLTFVFFSITTFATASDGDIRAHTLSAKSIVGMEVLSFIYSFTLSIVIFTNNSSKPEN